MSAETRTADPTLTAYARRRGGGTWNVAILNEYATDRPIAHRTVFHHATGMGPSYVPAHSRLACDQTRKVSDHERHLTKFARWYARPCRHCWPEVTP